MIPIRDELPTRKFPFITVILIVINIFIFLFEILLGHRLEPFFQYGGLVPASLWGRGELSTSFVTPWFTLFSSMFLHGNILHLGSNMLYLWIFGNNVEDFLGRFHYLIFYLISGMFAGLVHALLFPSSTIPTIGASGAIAGVMGGYLILFPGARVVVMLIFGFFVTFVRVKAILVLGIWILLQVVSGLTSLGMSSKGGVAWFAHIGGFLLGMLWCKIVSNRYYRTHYW
ncbi:rhomboid family intramembrane serine protease [Atribacter laminatus]|jgi:membrane associated rhomboid family serine protease|uniref:Rhomboid protease AarA n=1 Tax=Atribacter laminatus TaxID=2847778 RepID=A0A7T1F4A9_ATRLM|nr:rhomboid family intramembrane serine protease [Atribacter laminatus]QPM69355.1 Rhomboid protease AarA [Atribacter laminatus]